ncbi:MAG: sigma-70 family RNA polymerase sigma factor [Spirochaetes bacterium]|nr:sigma-70 family RNA polymerase sigma factor [Spirochaetota bacterium]
MSDKRPTAGEQSTMGLYLRELRSIPQLSREEEQAFAALAAQGDCKAREHLVRANLRFVILVAKRYRNRGVPLEDLVNEGNIGLIHAAERFDPDRGVRFVSYAVWWIRQTILKAIPENSHLIRVPRGCAGGRGRAQPHGQGTAN